MISFKAWRYLSEGGARSSFARTLSKFWGKHDRPVSILTAHRATRDDNKKANDALKKRFKGYGLSFYPVKGAGQEEDGEGEIQVAYEDSFIVSPISKNMSDDAFVDILQDLLYNPTGDEIPTHTQWGGLVKLPSRSSAFLLFQNNDDPQGPEDYQGEDELGNSARPKKPDDDFYTQMMQGDNAFVIDNK